MDNNGKIGVYAWENKINNKIYVGSGDPLYSIISDYYQPWYLKARNSLYIVRSLNKHTMSNFNLHILEYSDSENVIMCEQKWIDLMSKNRTGSNNYNKKHTAETIERFKEIAKNRDYVPVKGLEVEITDLETKTTTVHSSIREAAKFLNSDIKTLLRREASQKDKGVNKLYRNRYVIYINRKQ